MQGDLELPCKVTASLTAIYINLLKMEKYKQLMEDLYIKPSAEEFVSSFLDPVRSNRSQMSFRIGAL